MSNGNTPSVSDADKWVKAKSLSGVTIPDTVDTAVLGKGTLIYVFISEAIFKKFSNTYSLDGTDDKCKWKEVPGLKTLGVVGEKGAQVEVTTLKDTSRRYVPGMRTPADKSITLFDYTNNKYQKLLLSIASEGLLIPSFLIIFPNGRTGIFDIALSGYETTAPENNKPLELMLSGKQSLAVQWGYNDLPSAPS